MVKRIDPSPPEVTLSTLNTFQDSRNQIGYLWVLVLNSRLGHAHIHLSPCVHPVTLTTLPKPKVLHHHYCNFSKFHEGVLHKSEAKSGRGKLAMDQWAVGRLALSQSGCCSRCIALAIKKVNPGYRDLSSASHNSHLSTAFMSVSQRNHIKGPPSS